MLKEIRIKNYAIVDEVSLTFSEGFIVVTGETGAGKSVIVETISLLLGGRTSPDDIRHGEEEAIIEARFDPISKNSCHIDLPPEEDIILKRVLSKSGKNRAYINGALANLSTLKALGQGLAEIQGQHEHHRLTDPEWQLRLLDSFGGLLEDRSRYESDFSVWRTLLNERRELMQKISEKGQRESFLQYQLSEIRQANLEGGEEERLEKEERVLKNKECVIVSLRQADAHLSDETGGILLSFGGVYSSVDQVHAMTGDAEAERDLCQSALLHLKELSALIRRRLREIEACPERLQEVSERLYLIQKLKKKYKASVDELLVSVCAMEQEVDRFSEWEDRLRGVDLEVFKFEEKCSQQAANLSKRRKDVKNNLEEKIRLELDALGLEKTQFQVIFFETPLSLSGTDRIEFSIALPGEAQKSLLRVASGGELSRIMLALKVILAEADPTPTLVFDEVDAGVGGAVAERVGKRLARLARDHQVFCVTHLHQIASLSSHHFFVEKVWAGERMVTSVRPLSETERVQELARMMGGDQITAKVMSHAKEMRAAVRRQEEVSRSLKNNQEQ